MSRLCFCLLLSILGLSGFSSPGSLRTMWPHCVISFRVNIRPSRVVVYIVGVVSQSLIYVVTKWSWGTIMLLACSALSQLCFDLCCHVRGKLSSRDSMVRGAGLARANQLHFVLLVTCAAAVIGHQD